MREYTIIMNMGFNADNPMFTVSSKNEMHKIVDFLIEQGYIVEVQVSIDEESVD
jgi:hypothetical protein